MHTYRFCYTHTRPLFTPPPNTIYIWLGDQPVPDDIQSTSFVVREMFDDLDFYRPWLYGAAAPLAALRVLRAISDNGPGALIIQSAFRKFVTTQALGREASNYQTMRMITPDQIPPICLAEIPPLGFLLPQMIDISSIISQYATVHRLSDLLRYGALCCELGVLSDDECVQFLNSNKLIPGGCELGTLPLEVWLDVMQKLETVTLEFCRQGIPANLSPYQRRAVSFCNERLGSYLVLRHLIARFGNDLPPELFGFMTTVNLSDSATCQTSRRDCTRDDICVDASHLILRVRSITDRLLTPAVARLPGTTTTEKLTRFNEWDYSKWIHLYDTLTDETSAKMRKIAENFAHKPLISVVMPCYNPKPEWLKDAIESVRCQIYPRWELCIADDASTDPAIRPILEEYSRRDARIKVVFREINGHISAASNSALALATGEYVALLDHDDLLAEQALFWVAEAINRHPAAGLIYSDEDKITESGLRLDPYFKCDWNYDLFLAQNMISHLGVYKTELLRKIGGFREELEGAQDYDLALRCIEQLKASQIIHIPRILYHWRVHQASAAMSTQAKPYAHLAAERALNEHLARKGISARAEQRLDCCWYRVRYALPQPAPLVTLIIPTRNSLHLIRQCITSILKKTDYPNYEILIIDNGSDDPQTLAYFDIIRSDSRFRILRDNRPFNYSALNNRAVQAAQGELIGLINNDIEVKSSGWLSEMVSIALQPGVGAVGARLWYPDNTLQHGGVILGLGGIAGHSHKHFPKGHPGYMGRAVLQQSFSAVTAACLVVRRSVYLEVGGLEEENLKVAFGDIDFCLRVCEAGYRNVWTPFAEACRCESAMHSDEDTPEKQARLAGEARYMQERWGSLLTNDPAYSPNLTLEHEDFSYAWPPRVAPL